MIMNSKKKKLKVPLDIYINPHNSAYSVWL